MRILDDLLVDVILCLCRAMLDALQLTNRRFNVLVQKRAKGVCLRTLEVAELYADATIGPPQFITKLVTAAIRRRDGGLQREDLTLEDAPIEEMSRWFVNRLRHSVVTSQLLLAVPTDSPDLVESIKGTVLLKKGLWWDVRQAVDLDNARRFLSSFVGLQEVVLSCRDVSFRFDDDCFKLFEAMSLYHVNFREPRCTASTDAIISFLFGSSSAPGSENRVLHADFKHYDTTTRKAVAEKLIEAAISCTSTHNTTFIMDHRMHWDHDTEHMHVLAKYKDDLLHYGGSEWDGSHDDEGQSHRGCVLNIHQERFRIQVFCYSGGFQIRRACVDEVGFFPAWLETAKCVV